MSDRRTINELRERLGLVDASCPPSVRPLLVRHSDTQTDLEIATTELRMRELGTMICEYGQRHLWKALWCRYADENGSDENWVNPVL